MLIGCKNLRNHSIVASTHQSPAQCPPSDPSFGSDNTSPVCCPIGVLAAQAALAPQVANAKLSVSNDEWEVWQCEQPVSNTHHSKFGANSVSSRCQQNVLHVRSKCAKPHAIRVSSQCAAEAPRWIGRVYESGDPKFVYVLCKWYDAHLQNTQPMKQQHQSTEGAAKWEPSGLPKSICWHDTLVPLVGDGIAGPKNFVPIRMQLTCNPTISARHCLAEPSVLLHGQL